MQKRRGSLFSLALASMIVFAPLSAAAKPAAPEPVIVASGWQLQDAAKVPQSGAEVAAATFNTTGWYAATVPGTVLTTLVNNKVYPEPLYGENNRPEKIPESLNRTSYWYRTIVTVPQIYAGKHIWLNFDGINYSASVWVNGAEVGTTRGAFIRGKFDITAQREARQEGRARRAGLSAAPSRSPARAHPRQRRRPQRRHHCHRRPHLPLHHRLGLAPRHPRPRHRHLAKGLSLRHRPRADQESARHHRSAIAEDRLRRRRRPDHRREHNRPAAEGHPRRAASTNISFQQPVELAPHSSQFVTFDPKTTPVLHIDHPKLWWPNGYGPQNLYKLHLSFEQQNATTPTRRT